MVKANQVAGLAGAVAAGGAAASAQDLPSRLSIDRHLVNLTNWQQNEQPFWTKTLPEAPRVK
jgi:hypothetical protein